MSYSVRAHGIDVSACQGQIPWSGLGDDIAFAYCKGLQGDDFIDPYRESNLKSGADAGLLMGVYEFVYPLAKLDPKKCAEDCFNRTHGFGSQPGTLPPMLDFEWPSPDKWAQWGCTGPQMAAWLKVHAEAMTELYNGRKPLIYTYPWFEKSVVAGHFDDMDWAKDYPNCPADYRHKGSWPEDTWQPISLPPWGDKWTFCQFDGDGGLRLPNGVDCDFDIFNGTYAELEAFANVPEPAGDGGAVTDLREVLYGQ